MLYYFNEYKKFIVSKRYEESDTTSLPDGTSLNCLKSPVGRQLGNADFK